MADAEWEPVSEYWAIEILGLGGIFHVSDERMKEIKAALLKASPNSIIQSVDNFGREFNFRVDKYATACWCTPTIRDRIALDSAMIKQEEKERKSRLGLWESDDD